MKTIALIECAEPGIYTSPEAEVGEGVYQIEIAIDRSGLPSGPVAKIELEISEDGITWRSLGGATINGGDAKGRDGTILKESTYRVGYVDEGGEIAFSSSDRIRAHLTLLNIATVRVEVRV